MAIVAFLELSNSDPDLGEVLEDAPMKDLLWPKTPSPPIPGKTTASSQLRSRLRKKTAKLLGTRDAPTRQKREDTTELR